MPLPVPQLRDRCLHGELVAIGVMAQLIMERRMDEAAQAARFFHDVGLPLSLRQLGFDPYTRGPELDDVVNTSLGVFFIHYEPLKITRPLLKAALLEAYEFGTSMEKELAK